jgi:hypothetical protein
LTRTTCRCPSNVIAGANTRANHIPKPSRLDFTNQGNKRNRRGLQDSNDPKTSHGIPSSPNVAPNTSGVNNASMPESQGKNHKVPAPSTTPNVQEQQGKPLHSDGQRNAPRNLSKHGQSSDQSSSVANTRKAAQLTNAKSRARGKNYKMPAPSTAAHVPGQQGEPLHSKHGQSSHQSKGGETLLSQRQRHP